MFWIDKINIFTAVRRNDIDAARRLLKKTPQLVRERDSAGETPLHRALAMPGRDAIARLLLDCGASTCDRSDAGLHSLHFAAMGGSEALTRHLLMQPGIDVNARANDSTTPLHYAAYYLRANIVRLLMEHGADIHAKDLVAQTPLHMAGKAPVYGTSDVDTGQARCHREEIIRRLLAAGARLNFGVGANRNLMLLAIKEGKPDLLKTFLDRGGDPNSRRRGCPLLIEATRFGEGEAHLECLRILLKAGADVNAFMWGSRYEDNHQWQTASEQAQEMGLSTIVDLLMPHGASTGKRNSGPS